MGHTGRLYRVISTTSWSFASFDDPYHVLQASDVGAFEAITRSILTDAEPIAHNCQLNPGAPPTLWTFGFDADVTSNGLTTTGGTNGSFYTHPNLSGDGGVIQQLSANDIVLKISHGASAVGSVTIRVTQPVFFKFTYGAAIRALVEVRKSTYAPCRKGATGTLTVSSSTGTTTLQVCHRNLLEGTGLTNPNISS